jgi:hypothetical protein
MFRALAGGEKQDGFIDHAEYVQRQTQRYTKQLPNSYPVRGSTAILEDATSGLTSWDPNTRQASLRDVDISTYATSLDATDAMRAAYNTCITADLDDLAKNTDYAAKFRCGWLYKAGNPGNLPKVSRGYIGTKHGPAQFFRTGTPPQANGETWFWNLDDAKKQILKDRCNALVSCDDVGTVGFENCGFSTDRGIGIPIDGQGRVAYPKDPVLTAPQKTIVTRAGSCPPYAEYGTAAYELARSRNPCIPNRDGSLSRACMLQQITSAGCQQDGSLYALMEQSTVPDNYASLLQKSTAYRIYQQRANTPLIDGAVVDGNTSKAIALSNFRELSDESSKEGETGLNYAARDLCIKKGMIEKFDFCAEVTRTTPPPFTLECLQKAWRMAGGQPAGTQYPSLKNIDKYNSSFKNWGQWLDAVELSAANCKSSNQAVQKQALVTFMGIRREATLAAQIPRIVGAETFWFNSAINAFIGRRVKTVDPKFPTFSTWGAPENTGLNDFVEYYSLINIRPPQNMDIFLKFESDDGSVYGLNMPVDGQTSRGRTLYDIGSSMYSKIKTGMFGANWDQPPTSYTAKNSWSIKKGGPNYFVAFWQETGGMSHSKLMYTDANAAADFKEFPAEWMTLTQEPDAPMFSWEGSKSDKSENTFFSERRFPSVMEMNTAPAALIVDMADAINCPFPAGISLVNNGYGFATCKRRLAMSSWRTLTLFFTAGKNAVTAGNIPRECGTYGFPSTEAGQEAGRIRLYNSADCAAMNGNFYSGGECIKKGGGSWSWDCRDLNKFSAPIVLSLGPLQIGIVGTSVAVKWTSSTLNTSYTFPRAAIPDRKTVTYVTVNMRSQFKNQYPDTLTFCAGTLDQWTGGTITQSSMQTYTTTGNQPLFNPSEGVRLSLGDVRSQNSANVTVAAVRLFDYELDINDYKKDITNGWLMSYFNANE